MGDGVWSGASVARTCWVCGRFGDGRPGGDVSARRCRGRGSCRNVDTSLSEVRVVSCRGGLEGSCLGDTVRVDFGFVDGEAKQDGPPCREFEAIAVY